MNKLKSLWEKISTQVGRFLDRIELSVEDTDGTWVIIPTVLFERGAESFNVAIAFLNRSICFTYEQ